MLKAFPRLVQKQALAVSLQLAKKELPVAVLVIFENDAIKFGEPPLQFRTKYDHMPHHLDLANKSKLLRGYRRPVKAPQRCENLLPATFLMVPNNTLEPI